MISLKPTCETDTFESWWRRLIEVAANYGVKVNLSTGATLSGVNFMTMA
jgi:hypothetical protein